MNFNLRHYMSKNLISVPESMKVEEALMVMKNHHFRHLTVTNEQNQITGLVSDRDLFKSLNSEDIMLSQIMTKNIRQFDIDTDIREIVKEMLRLKISAFLITSKGRGVGIVTSEDLLHLLSQLLASHADQQLG